MANSFGDQLLKAGLVSQDQLDKAKKSKRKHQHQQIKQKTAVVDEAAAAARQAAAEKAARDRELSRRQRDAAERKAAQAQVRQLVESNRLPRDGGEVGYNFQDGTAIKKLYVSEEVRDKLARGVLRIVRLDDRYEVIPSVVAEKILARDKTCVIDHAASQAATGEDDPYADYKVPDDLMW
jgi:uncharacterized protein YaiL (DUF2058 family)